MGERFHAVQESFITQLNFLQVDAKTSHELSFVNARNFVEILMYFRVRCMQKDELVSWLLPNGVVCCGGGPMRALASDKEEEKLLLQSREKIQIGGR